MAKAVNNTVQAAIKPVHSVLRWTDRWDHVLARLGVRRSRHRVEPGLYALGAPDAGASVLVSANYTLSFDALRSALPGEDAYILVLDTKGINVWCAAGKGTFGTKELLHRIEDTDLARVVSHRTLILPQLGAPGVSAHEVKQRSGFRVEYGPVRAADLPEYLRTHKASPPMRRVSFTLADRAVLVPVEAVHIVLPVLLVTGLLLLTGAVHHFYNQAVAAVLAGTVLFPLLLPWIPTQDFSSKGFLLGAVMALPLILREALASPPPAWWRATAAALSSLLIVTSLSAFLALNFTGSTVFTSRSGVRREIFRYIPAMAICLGAGVGLTILLLRIL
jgi:hypothetical protein